MTDRSRPAGVLRSYYAFQLLYSGTLFQSIFFVYYDERVGLGAAAVLGLQSYFVAMRAAFELPAGALADRRSRRGCLVGAGLAMATGAATLLAWPTLIGAVVAETCFALSIALRAGVDSALVYDALARSGQTELYPRVESRGQALAALGSGAAAIAGSALVSLDVRLPYVGTIVLVLAASVFALRMTGGEVLAPQRLRALRLIADAARSAVRSRDILWVLSLAIVSVVVSHVYFYGQQPYMIAAGVPVYWFGIVFAATKAITAVVATQAWRIDAALGAKRTAAIIAALPVVGLSALSAVTSPWGAALLLSRGLLDGLWQPLSQIYMNRLAPSALRATLLSLQNLVGRLTLAATVAALGVGTAELGLHGSFAWAAGATALAGVLLVATHPRRARGSATS